LVKPQVVILGGGFAGLAAASQLDDDGYAVTLVDRGADFEYLPNLHELVSRFKKPGSLRLDRGRLVAHRGHTFCQSEVVEIDPGQRRVRTADGDVLAYDALIVAMGSAVTSRGVPGVAEHALPLRSISHGVEIGARLRQLVDDGGPQAITVVGGGFTGVECLGEILRRYRQHRALAIRLIEPGPRLLARQPRVVHRALRAVIEECDVELLFGESVAGLEPDRIQLASGSWLKSDLTLWTAGGGPSPLLAAAGLAAPGEWAPARRSLQSDFYDDVFIAGDSAGLRRQVAKQSYQATAMGRRAGKNVARLLTGRPLKKYSPPDEQLLITFGYLSGFYIDDDVVLEGAALCLARELLFQIGMAELDRPRRAGARRRLWKRLRNAAQLNALPGPLRTMLPFPFANSPRDRFDLPSLPRILKWRGAGSGPEEAGAAVATLERVGRVAGERAAGVLRVLGPRLLS
jgi:NADH dehydrogenase